MAKFNTRDLKTLRAVKDDYSPQPALVLLNLVDFSRNVQPGCRAEAPLALAHVSIYRNSLFSATSHTKHP